MNLNLIGTDWLDICPETIIELPHLLAAVLSLKDT